MKQVLCTQKDRNVQITFKLLGTVGSLNMKLLKINIVIVTGTHACTHTYTHTHTHTHTHTRTHTHYTNISVEINEANIIGVALHPAY